MPASDVSGSVRERMPWNLFPLKISLGNNSWREGGGTANCTFKQATCPSSPLLVSISLSWHVCLYTHVILSPAWIHLFISKGSGFTKTHKEVCLPMEKPGKGAHRTQRGFSAVSRTLCFPSVPPCRC